MSASIARVVCVGLAVGLVCAAASASGVVTQATISIGGPGSSSSEGFNDPGLLADGVTEASATLDLTFDDGTGVLTIVVTNTSPVIRGVCNPLLRDIYFNAPPQVTGMKLTAQSVSEGQLTSYSLNFDSDLLVGPNPNGAAGFGAFSVELNEPGGIGGSIANADADTVTGPPNSMAIGPVAFNINVSGGLGLTADDFAQTFSVIPPGNMPSHAAAHFQGGGPSCDSSAFINDGAEECYLLIGPTAGGDLFISPGPSEHPFDVDVGPISLAFGVNLAAQPRFPVIMSGASNGHSMATSMQVDEGVPGPAEYYGPMPGQVWVAQVIMWNPQEFPLQPEQSSNSVTFVIPSSGRVIGEVGGSTNGMHLDWTTVTDGDGGRYLTFPFTIDGL